MSYNVTAFNVKEINNLEIPIIDVLGNSSLHRYNFALCFAGGKLELRSSETKIDMSIGSNGALDIDSFQILGDSSGYIFEEAVIPLLEKTKGDLRAIVVWEGGDSIEKLQVNNGTVRRDEVNI